MAGKLVEHGFPLDLDAIRADVGDGVWGRPHLARALVRAGHAKNNDDAFDRFLGREHPWYVPYEKWKAAEVVRAIRDAGGVSSIAHAVWYKETDALIRALAVEGLDAIEVFHPDHGPDEERRFLSLARELRLATTAGSDFHGTPEGRKRPGAVTGDRRHARRAPRAQARETLRRSGRRRRGSRPPFSKPGLRVSRPGLRRGVPSPRPPGRHLSGRPAPHCGCGKRRSPCRKIC